MMFNFSENVPVWIVAGTVAAGGWYVDGIRDTQTINAAADEVKAERIAVLEERSVSVKANLVEIKNGIIRMEEHILELRK